MDTDSPTAPHDDTFEGDQLGAVLVVAAGAKEDPFIGALRLAGDGVFRVRAAGVTEVGEIGDESLDGIVVDLSGPASPSIEDVRRLRKLAPDATFLFRGDIELRETFPVQADFWVSRDDSVPAIAACLRGAVERRRLRERLREHDAQLAASDARFRSIVEGTADGILIVDADGRVRFVNPSAEKLFGRTADALLGEELGLAVLSGEKTEMDIVRGGESIVAELRVSNTAWEGQPAQVISLRDVTERKRSEERARRLVLERAARQQAEEAGRRFRFLAEASATLDRSLNPDATLTNLAKLIVPRVADWCVVDLVEGDRIRRVAGIHSDPDRQPLLGALTAQFAPYTDSPQPAARVIRTGKAEVYRGLDPDQMRLLAVDDHHVDLLTRLGVRSSVIVPLEAREQRLGAMTFVCGDRDFDDADVALIRAIASRAAQALENARLYEAALAASRAKSDFLAVMSHELRTPLNAILGYTDLLLTGVSGNVDQRQSKFLRRIRSGAVQLLQIIEEILVYTQMDVGHAQPRPSMVGTGELIDEVVSLADSLMRDRRLDFRVHVAQPDAMLFTDGGKLRQILVNLLSNAAKFTEEGGVEMRAEVRSEQLVVAVTDTGIGIAADDIDEIFEPFQQLEQGTTRRAGGTGLGLSISRQLARLLGGDLEVESAPGIGSTFTVRVPTRITTQPAADGTGSLEMPERPAEG